MRIGSRAYAEVMPRSFPRRAGSPWRILVHEHAGDRRSHDVTSDPAAPARHAETTRRLNEMRPEWSPAEDATSVTVLEGTEFDELVIGKWIHLEQLGTGRWWMNVGGVTLIVTADRDGRPRRVSVSGPGDYAEPEKGCVYEVEWSADDRAVLGLACAPARNSRHRAASPLAYRRNMTLLKFLLVFFSLGVAAWAALFTSLVLRREDGGLPGRMFDRMHDWAMSEPGDGEAWRPTSCS